MYIYIDVYVYICICILCKLAYLFTQFTPTSFTV